MSCLCPPIEMRSAAGHIRLKAAAGLKQALPEAPAHAHAEPQAQLPPAAASAAASSHAACTRSHSPQPFDLQSFVWAVLLVARLRLDTRQTQNDKEWRDRLHFQPPNCSDMAPTQMNVEQRQLKRSPVKLGAPDEVALIVHSGGLRRQADCQQGGSQV